MSVIPCPSLISCCPLCLSRLLCLQAELTKALGFEAPDGLAKALGGTRSRRFSAVVEDGKFKTLNLEEGGELQCSLANQIVEQLKK